MSKLSRVQKACILAELAPVSTSTAACGPCFSSVLQAWLQGLRIIPTPVCLPAKGNLEDVFATWVLLVFSCTSGCYFITCLCFIRVWWVLSVVETEESFKKQCWGQKAGWWCCLGLKECTAGLGNIFKHLMWKIGVLREDCIVCFFFFACQWVCISSVSFGTSTALPRKEKSDEWARIATKPGPNMLGGGGVI